MLLVVAAQVVDQPAHRDGAVALEFRGAIELCPVEAGEKAQGFRTRGAKLGEHLRTSYRP
jgi:hypothetical protein